VAAQALEGPAEEEVISESGISAIRLTPTLASAKLPMAVEANFELQYDGRNKLGSLFCELVANASALVRPRQPLGHFVERLTVRKKLHHALSIGRGKFGDFLLDRRRY